MPLPLQFDAVRTHLTAPVPLDLTVREHACVSVVGDETSGVDALGACALGLSRAATGRILVHDVDVSALPRREALAFRRRVGYLPAGDGLLQNLSLRDNVALPLRFGSDFSEREIEGRLKILLASARLILVAHLRPAQVGDEQRRRTALARALAFDPKLVILVQPFDGLTNLAARQVIELARGGDVPEGSRRTVLVLGHNLPHAIHARFEHRYRMTLDGLVQTN